MPRAKKRKAKKKPNALYMSEWSRWREDPMKQYEARSRIIPLERPQGSTYLDMCVGWHVESVEEVGRDSHAATIHCAEGDVHLYTDMSATSPTRALLGFDDSLNQSLKLIKNSRKKNVTIRKVDIATRETEVRRDLSSEEKDQVKRGWAEYRHNPPTEDNRTGLGEIPDGRLDGNILLANHSYAVIGLRLDGMKKLGYAYCRPEEFIQGGRLMPFGDVWLSLSDRQEEPAVRVDLTNESDGDRGSSTASPMSEIKHALEERINGTASAKNQPQIKEVLEEGPEIMQAFQKVCDEERALSPSGRPLD